MSVKPRERVVRLLLRILSRPYRLTRKALAHEFNVSLDTIKKDIEILRNIPELEFKQDEFDWTCAILPDSSFKELQYLQALTEKDRTTITTLINQSLSEKKALYLKKKVTT